MTSTKEPSQKDRTLFVINFDERTTEDILYELFLQSGPIETIVRKPDRNGQLIALITYKNIESVDYAIKLFNDLYLFGQRLKVNLSQNGTRDSMGARDSPKQQNGQLLDIQQTMSRGRSLDHFAQIPPQFTNPPILMENNFNNSNLHRHRSTHETHKRSFKQSSSYHSQNDYRSRSRSPRHKKRR